MALGTVVLLVALIDEFMLELRGQRQPAASAGSCCAMSDFAITTLLMLSLFALLGSGVWIGLTLAGVAWIGMQLFSSRHGRPVTRWPSPSGARRRAGRSPRCPCSSGWARSCFAPSSVARHVPRPGAVGIGLPGRLLHTNVIGCTIFAAVSPAPSAATCATIGKMTLPELGRRGYPEDITIGSLAGAGTLGLLIPPSIIMIVYGVTADVSIARLFVAGVIPGMVLAALFSGYLAVWAVMNPSQVPQPTER
jgi:C4-dicarboxylate transporter DctM subunit